MASEQGGAPHPVGDDFVAEVSNLSHVPLAGAVPAGGTTARQEPAAAVEAVRVSFGTRLSRRQRITRQLGVAGVLVMALALVLGSVPGVRDQVASAFRGPLPTPTAPLAAGAGYVYVATGAPWAAVTIDGHTIAHLPVMGSDPPLWLPRGRHTITWRADPFTAATCVISTPIAGSDTCPYDRARLIQPEATPTEWIITLFPTLATLPPDQRAALLRAAQTALDTLRSSATVLPGERYGAYSAPNVDAPGAVATQALRATLSYQLVTDAAQTRSCTNSNGQLGCGMLGQDCTQLCTVPVAGTVDYWSVYAVVNLFWRYTTLDGKTIIAAQNDVLFAPGMLLPLRISWDGTRWMVMAEAVAPQLAYDSYLNPPTGGFDTDPACLALGQNISLERILPAPSDPLYDLLGWQYIAAPHRADGCVGVATITSYTTLTPPSVTPPSPLLLRRFGVVLAANAVAHRLWPSLPLADAYEMNIAAQIVALSTGTPAGGNGSSR